VSTTCDGTDEDCEVTLRDHGGLESDDVESEICRAAGGVLKRGGPSKECEAGRLKGREGKGKTRGRGLRVVCVDGCGGVVRGWGGGMRRQDRKQREERDKSGYRRQQSAAGVALRRREGAGRTKICMLYREGGRRGRRDAAARGGQGGERKKTVVRSCT
jgi:hypothetical protein